MSDWYEQQRRDEQARKDKDAAKRAADDAAYELEREEQSRRRAEQAADTAKQALRAARAEAEEEREYAAEALETAREQVLRQTKERAVLVAALRALTTSVLALCADNPSEKTRAEFDARVKESVELLAVIDAQK